MRQSILGIVVCLLLGGLVVAGCGGDNSSSTVGGEAATDAEVGADTDGSSGAGEASTVAPTSESKAEFTAKANELCDKRRAEVQKKASKIFSSGQGGKSENPGVVLSRLVEDVIAPSLEGEVEDLQKLGTPDGDESEIEAIVAAIETMVAKAREDPKAFLNNPNEFNAASKLAGGYGIDACGALS